MKLKLSLFVILLLPAIIALATPPVEEGKSIFTTRCAGCHNISKVLTGPALAGVDQRRSIDWIINFVHSSQTVIKSGDKDATALFAKFNNIQMPDHKDLSEAQIKNVVEYIKTEAKAANAVPVATKTPIEKTYLPIVFQNYGFLLSFFAVFALLIGVTVFAVKVNNYKKAYFQAKS